MLCLPGLSSCHLLCQKLSGLLHFCNMEGKKKIWRNAQSRSVRNINAWLSRQWWFLVTGTSWPEQFITGSWRCAQLHVEEWCFSSHGCSTMLKLNCSDGTGAEVSSRFTDKSPSAFTSGHSEFLPSVWQSYPSRYSASGILHLWWSTDLSVIISNEKNWSVCFQQCITSPQSGVSWFKMPVIRWLKRFSSHICALKHTIFCEMIVQRGRIIHFFLTAHQRMITDWLNVQLSWGNQNLNWARKLSGFREPLASIPFFSWVLGGPPPSPPTCNPKKGSNSDRNQKPSVLGLQACEKSSVHGHLLQQSQPHTQLDRLRQHLPHWDATCPRAPRPECGVMRAILRSAPSLEVSHVEGAEKVQLRRSAEAPRHF